MIPRRKGKLSSFEKYLSTKVEKNASGANTKCQ